MADSIQVPVGYSFLRIINSGGFGTVVEMIEKSTNMHYAGKIVQCLTQKHKDRFDREVGRLKTFEHPRIIKLKESVAMEGNQVMVMELGGKSLADVVQDYAERKVRMPREEVYRVMEDIASALEMMHNHESGRTAHGDIKMENILMDADGHAKLCDFGAAESEDVSSSRSVMSQLYVSPERMESETGAATCEADVWALGVVLYWLLFGEPPFKAKNPIQLIREIASFKPIGIPNSCGEEERALLMRMMDPCAETRVTCRQLLLSKSFRCLVNTIEGVWKLKDEEQALRISAQKETVKMTVEKRKAEAKARTAEQEKWMAETREKKAEELKEQAERDRERMADEVWRIREQHGEARGRMEKRTMFVKAGSPRVTVPTAWVGTESLKTFDENTHSLTPTTLTQIVSLEKSTEWRTVFTLPIDEGEWELKIRGNDAVWIASLGFLKHPLPENATQRQCGSWMNGIGGHFILWDGRMWKGGEFKPAGTNKSLTRIGQTAAIRVNMRTREARLFVDDEEQPGIFTEIPSPLCLAKAMKFLESVPPIGQPQTDAFLNNFKQTSDESLENFVECIVVLMSAPSQAIPTATMMLLKNLIYHCSTNVNLSLVKANLIRQLINTLNPLSLSWIEAADIHTNLLAAIIESVWLATPDGLTLLGIEDDDEQQAVHATILKQVLMPSEEYIRHLCVNRFSIVDGDQSLNFLALLAQIIQICPSYRPTMKIVLHMPVFLAIPSCLTFFEYDEAIWSFLSSMVYTQREWNKQKGKYRRMWKEVQRMLRMEGMEDVIVEKLQNDKITACGGWIASASIEWNNLLGMNLPAFQ
ncbi:putative Carbon catabolite-derepressing protein kinase [Blattamonas nauphoetae]|uniref:Carbon catabolite-derepressing protein kinase n=1 Tax=Blattamonas nauphoetae TaxID=2049346 RepID=A0ABQ9XNG9_9EUKA|nr:putative Carbon catabolite-derepressing protein kinase [Blattamonas nauphoetae]